MERFMVINDDLAFFPELFVKKEPSIFANEFSCMLMNFPAVYSNSLKIARSRLCHSPHEGRDERLAHPEGTKRLTIASRERKRLVDRLFDLDCQSAGGVG